MQTSQLALRTSCAVLFLCSMTLTACDCGGEPGEGEGEGEEGEGEEGEGEAGEGEGEEGEGEGEGEEGEGEGEGEAPVLVSFFPAENAVDVATNVALTATFDQAMTPLDDESFVLREAGSDVDIAGVITTGADGITTTFVPVDPLVDDTTYRATITTSATSLAGTALADERAWNFATAAPDVIAPFVSSVVPRNGAVDVATNTRVVVTFSAAVDPLTLDGDTFVVTRDGAAVAGDIASTNFTATFTPDAPLAADAIFVVALTGGVQDAADTPLVPFSSTFTTGATAARGPAPVGLGAAGNFVILAKTAISTVPASAITGDVGLSPAAASFITGFSLVADATNVFSRSTQITGQAKAADYAVPTPSRLTTAVSNMEAAYTDAAGRPTPDFLELGTGEIGGETLAPGLYKWTSTVTIPTDVTISGGPNDVWIFQTSGDITMSANQRVLLAGGARAENIFWQVAGQVTIGADAHFEGIVLCQTSVTLETRSTMNGRILAQTAVALQQATVTRP